MGRLLILCASPRPDGNSRLLAEAFADGARGAGHEAGVVDLNHWMTGLLRDCRACRGADGSCSIQDRFDQLVHQLVVPADGLVYATPLYWYGMAAALKNFFDRLVCYVSASYPRHDEVAAGMTGKRSALLMSAEEAFPGANLGVVAQLQEVSRYLHHEFLGVVYGVGNKRGEVRFDPSEPLEQARRLGSRFFERHHSDYRIDSARPNAVWPAARASRQDAELGAYGDV